MKILILSLILLTCCSLAESPPRTNNHVIQRYNFQGLQALRQNELLEAQANFRLAFQIAPNAESLDGLGACEYYLGNFSNAQKYYIKAYEFNPQYYNSLINLAYLYEANGQLDLAEKLYIYLKQKYPQNYRLLNNFSAFQFDYYGEKKLLDVEFNLLQAKSIYPDVLILKNLIKVKGYGETN